MPQSHCETLKKLLFDPRRCSNPSSVLTFMGMVVGKALSAPDDVESLSEKQAEQAVEFLERWFPDRTASLVESICAKAQVTS